MISEVSSFHGSMIREVRTPVCTVACSISSDGCSVGLSLEGASEEDISELDKLLTVMADMRHSETASREEERERGREGVREKEKERVREGVREEKKGDKPTWGTTIAGVSSATIQGMYWSS